MQLDPIQRHSLKFCIKSNLCEHLFVGLLCGNKILRQRIAISQVTTCSLSENGRRNLFWSSSPPRNFSSPHKMKTWMWKVLKWHAEKCHSFRNLCADKREDKFFLSLFWLQCGITWWLPSYFGPPIIQPISELFLVLLLQYKNTIGINCLVASTLAIKETTDVFIIRVASVAFSLASIVSGAVTINWPNSQKIRSKQHLRNLLLRSFGFGQQSLFAITVTACN